MLFELNIDSTMEFSFIFGITLIGIQLKFEEWLSHQTASMPNAILQNENAVLSKIRITKLYFNEFCESLQKIPVKMFPST